ncbi:MAG: phosphatidylglycerophosphatase A [Candidatus Omnitrophota bacterium]|nr:phosphatidylglycerophosphatase A [Candidatus Omnitrophota bacterium]
MRTLIKLVASVFFIGYVPFIPGTAASLAGVGLYLLIKNSQIVYFIVTLVVICLGFLTAGWAERLFAKKDASQIVIDEVAGLLVAFWFVAYEPVYLTAGFVIYRLFDWLKPYPLRRLEKIGGSSGIMLDDIGAGIYTNIILQIAIYFFIK